MVILLSLAILSVLISVGLSVRAAGRLPADARVPVHMGIGGWDRYAPRKRGLWEWPVGVGIVAFVLGLASIGPAAPVPIQVLSALVLFAVLATQHAALKSAGSAGPQSHESARYPVPKWVAGVVIAVAVVPLVGTLAIFLWPRVGPPSEVRVDQDHLVLTMRGPYKAFSLRSKVRVALSSIVAVRADPNSRNLPRGSRLGTSAPGVIAGRFTSDDCRGFWAIDDGSDAVVIDLANEDFDRIVAEVDDPAAVADAIRRASHLEVEDALSSPCERS